MKTLIKAEWRLLLFGLLMTFWSAPGQTFFISLFSGAIRDELALSHSEFGGLYSVATLLSAAVIVWSGALVDRIPLRRFACTIIVILSLSTLSLSLINSAALLFIAFFLLRQFGQSLMMLTASTAMVRYLESNKGKATALSGMGYHLAEAIMPGLVLFMIAMIGWRLTLQAGSGVLLLLVMPLVWLLLNTHSLRHKRYLDSIAFTPHKSPDQPPPASIKKQWTRQEVLHDKRFYLFLPAFMAQVMLFTGFIFHQVHWVEGKGWSLITWGSLFAMYASVSIIAKLVTGVVIDKIGTIRIVPFVALPLALGLLLLASSSHISAGAGFLFLMGITTGVQTTISGPFWSDMYGSQHLGAIKSLTSALTAFASAIAPFAMGWLIDHGISIEVLALGSAIYIAFATGLALYARSLCRKSINEK